MILTLRPIKIWPEGWQDPHRRRDGSPFDAGYQQTLNLLDRELRHLGATSATLQVDATERDCRLDGHLRADARVQHPGVILTIETKRLGTQVFACDRFVTRGWSNRGAGASWKENVRAIALGLEALRKVERYGIAERGQQYAGYRELGAGIELGRAMTVEEAARFIAEYSDDPTGRLSDVEDDPSFALALFKDAAKNLHPDAGGDPELFRKLVAARELLKASFGRVA